MEINRREALGTIGSLGIGGLLTACAGNGRLGASSLLAGRLGPTTAGQGSVSLIKKIDHMFTVVDDAPGAIAFMHDVLGLPLAWPFADYGGFASGAINLGNLNLEFVQAASGFTAYHPARINAVAFEPATTIDAAFVQELDRRGIVHSAPMPAPLWTTMFFGGLTATVGIFAIDYHIAAAKDAVLRQQALDATGGGLLRVLDAKELVLGVTDLKAARDRWQALLSPAVPHGPSRWRLGTGPALHLVHHHDERVLDLVLLSAAPHANATLRSLRKPNDPLAGLPLWFAHGGRGARPPETPASDPVDEAEHTAHSNRLIRGFSRGSRQVDQFDHNRSPVTRLMSRRNAV